MRESRRLHKIKEYYFSKKLSEISKLSQQGKEIINLGIGSPDLPPSQDVIDALIKTANEPSSHAYQSYRGSKELRIAMADFYKKYYNVAIDYEHEIIPLTGSKEGIMHISMAFINPGDKVLVPDPGYMTYRSATLLADGEPISYNLLPSNHYLPDFYELEKMDLNKVRIMWVNYPHMPSGATADIDVFNKLAEFGQKHDILIVNDNPYSFILNNKPESILKADPSFHTIMELNSLSKSHNMAGWRIGMLTGKKAHIDAVMKFKSNMDSGMFLAIQKAAVKALTLDQEWFQNLNKEYRRRKKIGQLIFDKLNIAYKPSQSGMFLWGQLSDNMDAKSFTDRLLNEKGIFLAPGFIFGKNATSYVRLSLTNDIQTLQKVYNKI